MIALLAQSGIESAEPVSEWVKLAASIVVLTLGAGVAIGYLRGPFADVDPASRAGGRPWRKLGAAICVVVAVMFVAGVYLLDGKPPRHIFLAYWILILVLVMWLCGLALKDLLHTRRWLTSHLSARGSSSLGESSDDRSESERDS